ncbi:hypothetical protein F9C07_6997 [Aspergillus flavus]|uniref:Uncharacterized protein n=5 Tax=Aspergillus subgen. Circumdati TaxID=2720871 RepID=B8NFL7_ASPFN|nr:unnamed protein product [Aspergillus oryzae RIB40]XP_041144758.1 uncharacterized protein G4B84_005090 [Aspergillus flavus NRRL3357]KAJ1713622.1 hypothetical protein NYO67_4231 [Aspergillus flavus]OOO14531.1 hypothetical protein OAory_01031260 [Aspergillus oryzae]GMG53003.1 unnamed protein product [Aspergillus oryzae var. brunneus]QMW29755.1 hypothetical protein G4B84_005090 [Aspergillus flavus NRRL3357]QMW41828.1 hypothetical protein G4B11_005152 [Aspergillus flavus]
MSGGRSTSPISVPPSSRQRRASLASGLGLADYLSKSGNQGTTSSVPTGPMASAVANAQSHHGRRLSITTLGLSGSPTQTSPFGGRNLRHGSVSSSMGSNPASLEDAVIEDNENGPPSVTPTSPFARRVSFGAQALRDVRGGSTGNGRYPSPWSPVAGRRSNASPASSTSINTTTVSVAATTHKVISENDRSNPSWRPLGEGFNWSEALRTRAERAPSIGNNSSNTPQAQHTANPAQSGQHQRAASIASMEQPAREMPKQPRQNKPDFFQEKILRGDFMD